LEVQNPTNQYLQINNFRIIGPNGTDLGSWSVSWDVQPASTNTFYYVGSASQTVDPNTNYVVIFSGLIGNQQFSETVSVVSTD
jgi:P pilus assembly chaperone PapD